ncbi:MAG TPA: phosphoribosylamine--glycine ligase [Casimicrobiaceae bacterium]|nr:phosphoribosylamine--glycine ligase [Casimicrobiaceae bacterium]
MKVLVVGGGGREHALAWKLAQSPRVTQVYVAPGNAGTGDDPDIANVDIVDIDALVAFAKQQGVGLTVVGPEAPLAAGIVDAFEAAGLRIFGPTRAAARLESSKDFAKAFMARHDIPTAPYRTFTDATQAHAYVDAHGTPVVVKADGLAAGKGVVVSTDAASAHHAIDAMLGAGAFGTAGARVVIEDFLDGEEASFIVMVDGVHVLPLASSQDHKRLRDGDRGPNTGGMGAYSPAPVVTPTVHARIMREVIAPTIEGMRAEGTPYRGFLYAGVMIDAAGIPRVLEFNCRLGDPEAQPILMRLRSDLVVLVEHALAGTLDRVDADWDRRPALTVVLAAHGYPDAPRRGDLIEGLERVNRDTHPDVSVFHAGTARDTEGVKATGGRVLGVTALGDSLRQAQRAAYAAISSIRFDGMQYRSDIGHRALARRGNAS